MQKKITHLGATMGVIGLALLGTFAVPTIAVAAEVESITSVAANPSDVRIGEQFSVDVTFSAPGGTRAGDTFTLNVPISYVSARLDSAQVKDNDDNVIANCASTSTAITCTYTDYVETHANVTGTVRFITTANRSNGSSGLDWTTGTGTVFHTANTIAASPGGFPWRLAKNGETLADGTIRYYSGFPGTVLSPNYSEWTDTYDSRLILNKSTVAVQTRTPAFNNWVSIDPSEYTVTFDDANHTFSVKFLDPVRDSSLAYRMVYIMQPSSGATGGSPLNNTVAAGEQTFSYDYTYFSGGGGGGGDQGTLSWTKADEKGQLLPGAAFHVVGPYGFDKTIVDNDSSDTNSAAGKFGLDHLPIGVYTLTEVTAPVGYRLEQQNWQATVSSTQLAGSFGTIVNTPLPGTVTWRLVDADGNPLPSGTFTLEGPNGYQRVISDNGDLDTNSADGEITIEGLPWGNYTLTQTTGPAGYKIDTVVLTGTLDATHLVGDLGRLVDTKLSPVVPVVPVVPDPPHNEDPTTPPSSTPEASTGSTPATAPYVQAQKPTPENAPEAKLSNTHTTTLEVTGGESPLWLMIGGLSLVAVGAAAMVARKKLRLK
ncbi:hypothetical protein G7068_09630 [Leucobacter viscericola]|uniref:LPXTG-motif cell wall anchor domain-containing protein n=1 Tax=Leucobacter viscericola TaxID=2714935 RepID=A0A6G7XFP0_9MICO|nr:SpaA isopeptide-forming pilin-related protein [Leucobacter viscericola]QIK63430.1 hypothetical protein G7068_09630 [Leucobacter viscericola]